MSRPCHCSGGPTPADQREYLNLNLRLMARLNVKLAFRHDTSGLQFAPEVADSPEVCPSPASRLPQSNDMRVSAVVPVCIGCGHSVACAPRRCGFAAHAVAFRAISGKS